MARQMICQVRLLNIDGLLLPVLQHHGAVPYACKVKLLVQVIWQASVKSYTFSACCYCHGDVWWDWLHYTLCSRQVDPKNVTAPFTSSASFPHISSASQGLLFHLLNAILLDGAKASN